MYVAFPRSDYYAPSDYLQGFGVFVGVSLTYSPPSLPSLAGSPVFVMEDASGMLEGACSSLPRPRFAASSW